MFRLVVLLLYIYLHFDIDLANHIWSNSNFQNSAIARDSHRSPAVPFALLPFRFFSLFIQSRKWIHSIHQLRCVFVRVLASYALHFTHIHSLTENNLTSPPRPSSSSLLRTHHHFYHIVYSNKTRKNSVHRTPLQFKQIQNERERESQRARENKPIRNSPQLKFKLIHHTF